LSKLKALAGDTILYGASTILGRLLNWLLTPFYIQTLVKEDLGAVVNLYSYISVLLVLLSFGFETGYFRFSDHEKRNSILYTLLLPVFLWSLLFVGCIYFWRIELAQSIGNNIIDSDIFLYSALIVAIDAVVSVPFADLRYQGKSKKYAGLRFLQVLIVVVFNVFFLYLCPLMLENGIDFVKYVFIEENRLKYVFISNLISSATIFVLLSPILLKEKFSFSKELLKQVMKYSYPIVLVGLFGMVIQNIDKILLPELLSENGMEQLAVYGANFKIGILMALFIQSFRLAFEPFFFKEGKEKASNDLYASILKYFTIFGMVIYVGVLAGLDFINILLTPAYMSGNKIIPWVLLGQLLFGIYYSLSLWYKLTDRTIYGSIMGFIGMVVVVIGNIVLVPYIGYLGSAISSCLCFGLMVVMSYVLGQKYYPVPYDLRSILIHFSLGIVFGFILLQFNDYDPKFRYLLKAFIFVAYLLLIYIVERQQFLKIIKHGKR